MVSIGGEFFDQLLHGTRGIHSVVQTDEEKITVDREEKEDVVLQQCQYEIEMGEPKIQKNKKNCAEVVSIRENYRIRM